MLSATFLVFTVVFLVLYWTINKSKIRKVNLPGPRCWPFIGSALEMDKLTYLSFNKWSQKYGPMCKVKLGPQELVLLSDNKIVKDMFVQDAFVGRTSVDEFNLFEGENRGIVNSEGQVWEEQRRFVVRQLRDLGFGKSSMESVIMEEVNEFLNRLSRRNEEPMDNVKNELSMALTNSLWYIVAGTRYSQEDPKLKEVHRHIQGAFEDAAKAGGLILVAPWIKYILPEKSGYNTLRRAMANTANFVRNTIEEHKSSFQEESPRDFIDVYLTEIKSTTDPSSSFYGEEGERQLINTAADLFQAGTETTSTTLSWAILHLLDQPEIQRKLQAEIDSVTGGSRQVSFSDRINMPYAQAMINELLRISIVPLGAPHRVLFDTVYKGVFFPKGLGIFVNMHYLHHDPTLWDNPDEFRPERFLTPDEKHVKKVEHLNPFLIGRRQCPGEALARDSVFLFLTNIMQKFDIVPAPNSPRPDLVPAINFIIEPKPYKVVFRERKQ